MATVTSLTEAKINELVAGWEGVELSQEQINALVQQLWNNNESQDANLTEFRDVILPQLRDDLAAGSIRVSDLNDVVLPDLQAEMDQAQLELINIQTVNLPQLTDMLQTNADWIVELDEITLPALNARLDANDTALSDLNTVTLPGLNDRLNALETAGGFDPAALQAEIDAAEAAINQLNTVSLPALDTRLDEAEATLAGFDISVLQADLDAAEAKINTLETETLPALDTRLDTNEGAINNLNTVTLPGLSTRIGTAEGEVDALQGKFPIAGPDIQANAITANHIGADQVTASEIAANTITAAEIAADTITANEIAANAITVNELAANAVTAAKIAADTITAAQIAAGAITTSEIAADAVTAVKIAANTISAREIAADAITTSELAADAVTAENIFAGSVTTAKIAANAVTANEIAADAITAVKIAADAVTTAKLAAGAVTADEIGAGAITTAKIAAGAVTANEIAADTITANKIATGAITATELAADSVTANAIAANAVTASEIAAGAVTADEIAAGAVTALKVAAGAVTTKSLAVVGDNQVSDPGFESADAFSIHYVLNNATLVRGFDTAVKRSGAQSLKHTLGAPLTVGTQAILFDGAVTDINSHPLVAPGETWHGGIWARCSTGAACTLRVGVLMRRLSAPSTSYTNVYDSYRPLTDQWQYFSKEALYPADAGETGYVTVQIAVNGGTTGDVIYYDDSKLFKRYEGSLIVDGTIVGTKLMADTITANEIATDAITTNEIAAGAITADEIAAGAVTAEKVSSEIIVAGTVYGQDGYFGVINVDQIQSGSLKADVGLLGSLRVGEITIDPLVGITIPSPKGDTVLSSLGLGSRFAGAVETDDLTVDGGLTLNAANNQINGSLKLANVVVAPSTKPSVSNFWPWTAPIGADTMHLTDSHDGTKWVSIHYTSKSIRSYNKVTGALVDNIAASSWPSNWQYGVNDIARGGNYYFMIHWNYNDASWYLNRVGNAFGSFTSLDKIVAGSAVGLAPTVGWDPVTNEVLVAYAATGTNSGKIRVYRYTTAGVRTASELWDTNNQWDGGNWVEEGSFAYSIGRGPLGKNGEDRVYMVFGTGIRIFDPATKTIEWWPAKAEAAKGVCVELNGKVRYMGYDTYRIYEWVKETNWPTDSSPITIGHAWYDSDPAGTGKHETQLGPTNAYTGYYRWAGIQIDTNAPSDTGQPDSPDSVAIYINNHRQPDVPPGKVSNQYRSYVLSNTPPKAANEFASAAPNPGSIISDATFVDGVTPKLRLKGDGTGHWGDLTVDGNGKAVIGGDSGWISVVNFVTGWENYGGTWPTVAYRKIGNRVFLRGLIRGTSVLAGTMFTLPVGFRPSYDGIYAASTAQWAKTIDAVGDGAKDTGNKGTGSAGTSHFHDISAYDIRTTVDIDNIATRCDVLATGEVQHNGGAQNHGGSSWMSLFGIVFLTD